MLNDWIYPYRFLICLTFTFENKKRIFSLILFVLMCLQISLAKSVSAPKTNNRIFGQREHLQELDRWSYHQGVTAYSNLFIWHDWLTKLWSSRYRRLKVSRQRSFFFIPLTNWYIFFAFCSNSCVKFLFGSFLVLAERNKAKHFDLWCLFAYWWSKTINIFFSLYKWYQWLVKASAISEYKFSFMRLASF